MTSLFRLMLKMSITASYVIAVVLVLRFLMQRFPRKYSYYLWTAVLFRLCCPFSFSSVLSIFNFSAKRGEDVIIDLSGVPVSPSAATEGIIGSIDLGSPILTEAVKETLLAPEQSIMVNPAGPQPTTPVIAPAAGSATHPDLFTVLTVIWIAGIVFMAVYALISYLKLKKELEFAVPFHGNVMQADVQSPFLLGLIKPTIYIPFDIDESALAISLAHERYHLLRKDNWTRALSYCLLCIYWMNPMCWLAFFLMTKDMEMSCDEYVLSGKDDLRIQYSDALLGLSTERETPIMAAITFGGDNVKERIKNIMRFKHASKIISAIGALLCVATLVFCISNGRANAALTAESSEKDTDVISEITEENVSFGPIRQIGKRIGSTTGSPAISSLGCYQINGWNNPEFGNIIFTDYVTQETRFLCDDPNCDHNSPDCTSYIPYPSRTSLFTDYSGNHLYLLFNGIEANDREEAAPGSITEMNMDGSGRRTVCVLPEGEMFSAQMMFIAGDEYVFLLTRHKEPVTIEEWDFETETTIEKEGQRWTDVIEKIWFKDGKREKIKQLRNGVDGLDALVGAVEDQYLMLVCWDGNTDSSMGSKVFLDQNGETVKTSEPYKSGEYWYVDDHCYIKIEKDGEIATATIEYDDSDEIKTIKDIPYTSSAYAVLYGGYDNKFFMSYNWVEDGYNRERAFILDFGSETWRDFDLRLESNTHYFVTPIADAGNDYLVLIDRSDTTISLVDADGDPCTYDYYNRPTFALMTKDDYWNSVPNYRYIEDKLD